MKKFLTCCLLVIILFIIESLSLVNVFFMIYKSLGNTFWFVASLTSISAFLWFINLKFVFQIYNMMTIGEYHEKQLKNQKS